MGESMISRRGFLTGAAAVAAGSAITGLAGCAASTGDEQPWLPERWDAEADVVVVGYGGSGSLAALAAAEAGASVIALEKSPELDGGNFGCSSGCIHDCPGSDLEEWYKTYVHGGYGSAASEEVIKPVMKDANDSVDWLESYGISVDWSKREADGHMYPATYLEGYVSGKEDRTGHYLFEAIHEVALSHGAEVRTATPGKKLIQNPMTREILGVEAEDPNGNALFVKAKKGVILACGGWENNPKMFANYSRIAPRTINLGTPYNTGDGIPMALSVGANLWHMNLYHNGVLTFTQPALESGAGFCSCFAKKFPQEFCIVDCNGKRFMDESYIVAHDNNHKPAFDFSSQNTFNKEAVSTDPAVLKYAGQTSDFVHLPMFMVFDQTKFDGQNPLVNYDAGQGYSVVWNQFHPDNPMVDWKDNEAAVKKGWIFKGNTIEELAKNIKGERPCGDESEAINGIDPVVLSETIAAYNACCEAGEDVELGRAPGTLKPLTNPPFYAIEVSWLTVFTEGGPERNENCQTIDAWGEPIPRLYNVGEFGSFNSFLYSFGNVLQAMTTGHLAGIHAAGLDAWDGEQAKKQ